MMNVLYAGIDNPISISVPGVAMNGVSATMTNGSLTRSGDHWVAHPSKVGEEAVVTVNAEMDGRQMTVASTKFRVRKLPDPTPYIAYKDANGNTSHYKGGGRGLSKTFLLNAPGIEAAMTCSTSSSRCCRSRRCSSIRWGTPSPKCRRGASSPSARKILSGASAAASASISRASRLSVPTA